MELNRFDKDMRQNVARKKAMMKSVATQRILLIKHCSEYGYRKRYNAVMWDEPGIIHNNVAMLNKTCQRQNDMHIIKTRKQLTLFVNNEPMLVIRKLSSAHHNGSRWIIEQYTNDKRHRSTFQHGFVFTLRVPYMPIRMGVFFKAPVHQDFSNFTHHFRTRDTNDIIDHSLSMIPVDEPRSGFKYHKISNNFDLTAVLNDLAPNNAITNLIPYHESKKNFALYQEHRLYRSNTTSDVTHDVKVSTGDSISSDAISSDARTLTTLKKQDSSIKNYLYNFYNPSTDTSSKPYIAMTRYQHDLFITNYIEPSTPAIAFIVSVLACNA